MLAYGSRSMVALAALVALGSAMATPAQAQPPGPDMHGGPHGGPADMADHHMGRLFDRLHLTPEQRERMRQMRERHLAATRDMRERLEQKRRMLFQLMRRPEATKDQAMAVERDIDALQAQLGQARLAAWFEARSVLTPQQLQMLAKLPGPGPHERRPGPRP